jgi:hypothetical protein
MSPPPNVTVNFPVPFPALVMGDGAVKLTKVNGVWHVGLAYTNQLDRVPLPSAFAADTLLYYDPGTAAFYQVSITELFGLVGSIPNPVFDTVAGVYNVTTETVLLVNKTVGAANNVQLPTIASRNGVPIVIKDFKGDAAANNITALPSGAETIEGAGSKVINTNFGRLKLVPIADQMVYRLRAMT